MADSLMTLRLAVKEVAQELGLYATFMPKPAIGIQGSGMHTHFKLVEDGSGANAFFEPGGPGGLSKVGRGFVAGLLQHARAITAVTNQWINSYKRLVPGYEAPVHVCWAHRNRSALVRVPAARPGDDRACRVEYRALDPACNPYLAFAVILAAGLDGVARGLEPPAEATDNIYAMSEEERRAIGIASPPDPLLDELQTELSVDVDLLGVEGGLRRFRRRAMFRTAARDLLGASLEEVVAEITAIAEACIERACAEAAGGVAVIGMGKLGGEELNYASDVDLIFLHGGSGGDRQQEAERAVKRVIALLSEPTAEGIALRV